MSDSQEDQRDRKATSDGSESVDRDAAPDSEAPDTAPASDAPDDAPASDAPDTAPAEGKSPSDTDTASGTDHATDRELDPALAAEIAAIEAARDAADAEERARIEEIMAHKLHGEVSDEERARVLAMFPRDRDRNIDSHNTDEYAAAREVAGDPDALLRARLAAEREAEARRRAEALAARERVDDGQAKPWRMLFHGLIGLSGAIVLAALVLHGLDVGPDGLDTWTMTLASGALLGALLVWSRAAFQPLRLEDLGPDVDRVKVRHQRDLVLKTIAITSTLLFVVVAFIEFIAGLVAFGVIRDLSTTQITLAKNFVYIPTILLGVVVGACYVRRRVPSFETPFKHQREVEWGLLGLFGAATLLALLFSIGLPSVVRLTDIQARQGIYLQVLAVGALLALANLRLGYPNVVAIIRAEIKRSKDADRKDAKALHRRMVRNYVMALVFVVLSIAFLVANAAGIVSTAEAAQADIFLIVYVMFATLFLGIILVNFYQSQQLRKKVFHKGGETGPIGKRRYDHAQVVRVTVIAVSAGLFGLFTFFAALVGTGLLTQLGPFELTPRHGTDFFVFGVLGGLGPFGFYYARESNRIRLIDEKFPDLLRDLAESQRAGMTLPRALVTAAKGEYGPLTKEVKIMSAQVEWGVSFTEALQRFAKRTKTPLIERTVSLVIEAAQSGGNVVDILSAASDDAREIRGILAERKAQMSVYSLIIYIAFFVFLTVIAVLNSQFIPELAKSTSQVAGTDLGGISFGEIDVPAFQQLFFHAALIQGIGGGLVSGVMTEGHPYSGMRHSFNMALISYILFRFVIL